MWLNRCLERVNFSGVPSRGASYSWHRNSQFRSPLISAARSCSARSRRHCLLCKEGGDRQPPRTSNITELLSVLLGVTDNVEALTYMASPPQTQIPTTNYQPRKEPPTFEAASPLTQRGHCLLSCSLAVCNSSESAKETPPPPSKPTWKFRMGHRAPLGVKREFPEQRACSFLDVSQLLLEGAGSRVEYVSSFGTCAFDRSEH